MQNLAALTLYFAVLMSVAGLVAVVAAGSLAVTVIRARRRLGVPASAASPSTANQAAPDASTGATDRGIPRHPARHLTHQH